MEDRLSEHHIRGWRAESPKGLQGMSLSKITVSFHRHRYAKQCPPTVCHSVCHHSSRACAKVVFLVSQTPVGAVLSYVTIRQVNLHKHTTIICSAYNVTTYITDTLYIILYTVHYYILIHDTHTYYHMLRLHLYVTTYVVTFCFADVLIMDPPGATWNRC